MALLVRFYLLWLNCTVARQFSKLALCDFIQGGQERSDYPDCRELADWRALQGRLDPLDRLGLVEALEQWESQEALVYRVRWAPLGPMALLDWSAQLGLEEHQVSHGSSLCRHHLYGYVATLVPHFLSRWYYTPHLYRICVKFGQRMFCYTIIQFCTSVALCVKYLYVGLRRRSIKLWKKCS